MSSSLPPHHDDDLSDEGAVPAITVAVPKYEPHFLRSAPEEFTEEDMASPAFRKMLLDNLRRLAADNNDLKNFREDYYLAHERTSVLEAKLTPMAEMAIMSNFALALGGIITGTGITFITAQINGQVSTAGWVMLLLGVASLSTPVAARRLAK